LVPYRECPGSGVALAELYLVMASILKVFNIEYPVGKDGMSYIPKTRYTSGVIRSVDLVIPVIADTYQMVY
jgi:hypothetical protein